jgi:hypothetical protein
MLGLLLLALGVFRRLRRRTQSYSEGRTFKARLPPWVQTVEKVVWIAMLLLIGGVVLRSFWAAHGVVMPGHPVKGASAVFSVMGAGLIAVPLAMLGANAVSWLLPPVRAANLRAMDGLHVSFGDLNRGLVLFGCVSVPVGIIELVAAIFEPWAR